MRFKQGDHVWAIDVPGNPMKVCIVEPPTPSLATTSTKYTCKYVHPLTNQPEGSCTYIFYEPELVATEEEALLLKCMYGV